MSPGSSVALSASTSVGATSYDGIFFKKRREKYKLKQYISIFFKKFQVIFYRRQVLMAV